MKPHFKHVCGRWFCFFGPYDAVGVGSTVRVAWESMIERAQFAAKMGVNWLTAKPL